MRLCPARCVPADGLVPWVALTAFIGGYTFTLYKPVPNFLILAACTLILTLLFRFSGTITDRLNDILGILCPARSLICGIYFICHAKSLPEFLTFLSCTILCCACGIYLFHEAAPASPHSQGGVWYLDYSVEPGFCCGRLLLHSGRRPIPYGTEIQRLLPGRHLCGKGDL